MEPKHKMIVLNPSTIARDSDFVFIRMWKTIVAPAIVVSIEPVQTFKRMWNKCQCRKMNAIFKRGTHSIAFNRENLFIKRWYRIKFKNTRISDCRLNAWRVLGVMDCCIHACLATNKVTIWFFSWMRNRWRRTFVRVDVWLDVNFYQWFIWCHVCSRCFHSTRKTFRMWMRIYV